MKAHEALELSDEAVYKNDNVQPMIEKIYATIKMAANVGNYRVLWAMPDEPRPTKGQLEKITSILTNDGFICEISGISRDYLRVAWGRKPVEVKKKPWYHIFSEYESFDD